MRSVRGACRALEEPKKGQVMTMNIKPLAIKLIEELDAEATKFKMVLLVVIFQDAATVFIRSDRTIRLGALAVALARGGRAVGFIGLQDDGESLSFYRRVLPGFEPKEIFSEYLASLTDEIQETLYQGDV